MYNILTQVIQSLAEIPDEEILKFQSIGQTKSIKAGNNFISGGQIPGKFGIVIQGLFRYVYSTASGKEFTKAFMPEYNFLSSYSAMIQKYPSYYSIEALEDSEVFEINYRQWQELQEENPCWKDFLISLLEKGYFIKERREREFLLLDAENRYKNFIDEYPGLEKRVKQHMVASYLGITPVALSRIRKKMNLINPG